MHDKIPRILTTAIEQQNVLLEAPIDLSQGDDSPLYGQSGQIDSLTLVSILVDADAMLSAEMCIVACLADTSDLPPSATPFATFGTLCAHAMRRCAAAAATQQV